MNNDRLVGHDDGASAVEYSLLAVAVAAVVVVVVFAIGGYVDGSFRDTCNDFDSVGASTTGDECPS